MKRVMLTIAYDGTDYHGWQIQENGNTVEGELNKAIMQLTGENVELIGGSRTDAGVHALCNVAVFDTESSIPGDKFMYALNQRLDKSIRVVDSKDVEADFHPRHCDTKKTYEYRILNTKIPIPTKRLYAYHTYIPLDINRMQEASKYIEGEHDFSAFCSAGAQVDSKVRTVYSCNVTKNGDDIIISVSGNGFLYNMVRIIAGTLMEAGFGRIEPAYVESIINSMDRAKAGPTAPACGLCLVKYEFLDD